MKIKLLDKLAALLLRRKSTLFDDASSTLLAFLGVTSFLVAAYLGLILTSVVPKLIEASNSGTMGSLAVAL
jgi:hypothetical protein